MQRVTRRRAEFAIVAIFEAQPVGEHIGRERAGDQQAAVFPLDHAGPFGTVLIAEEIADQRGEQIDRGDDAVEMAVFVMHHGHRYFGLLQHAQRIDRIELIGHDLGLDHQGAQIDRFLGDQARQDIAHLDHAQHPVGRAFRHGHERMRAGVDRRTNGRRVRIGIDPVDFGTRGHKLAYGPLGEAHDALQHLVLFAFDHPAAGGFGKEHVQFFRRDRALPRGTHAEQANQHARGRIEQPHERRRHARQDRHGPRHDQRDGHRRPQRDLLGHELADDQRGIGGDGDDRREADFRGILLGHAQHGEPFARGSAQAGARIGTRNDPDQRDADLHGRQELARIGCQGDGRGGALAPFGGGLLEARCLGRHDGKLAHGEDAVEHDQPDDDQQVCPGKGCHAATASTKVRRCQRPA